MDKIPRRHRELLEELIRRHRYELFQRGDADCALIMDLINTDKIINVDEPHDAITSRNTVLRINRSVKQPLV